MLDRRTFLGHTAFLNLFPLAGWSSREDITAPHKASRQGPFNPIAGAAYGKGKSRLFIAHRGVNLKQSIAGENSLEAIRLAARAGFDAVEFDIRRSADGHWVVMHDETLNRSMLHSDGSVLEQPVKVSDHSLESLKSNFILKATEIRNRTRIPTMKEFLLACKRAAVIPFIEIKPHGLADDTYRQIIREADQAVGRGNYVITSNNEANETIRRLGIQYVTLMGILYQTTFDKIAHLNNVIMAVSTSRFSPAEYAQHVAQANLSGLPTESSADNFERFCLINDHAVDVVSTDLLAADPADGGAWMDRISSDDTFEGFTHTGNQTGGRLTLKAGDTLRLKSEHSPLYFGGLFFEINLEGKCEVALGGQTFVINSPESKTYTHQVLIYNQAPRFLLTAESPCTVRGIEIKIAKY